jgi:hypothetical protein
MIKRLALAGLLAAASWPALAAGCPGNITNGYGFSDVNRTPQAFAAQVLGDCRVVPWHLLVDANGTPYSGTYGLPVSQQGTWTFGLSGPIPAGTNVIGHVLVDNYPATQPVSVTVLPLPTGAATAAAQVAQSTALGTIDTDLKATQPRAIASNAPSVLTTGSLTNSGDTVVLAVDGMNTSVVQVGAGSWAGTVIVEASADAGTTWTGVNVIPYAGGAATANPLPGGLYEMAVGGLTNLRVRATTAITNGPAAITLRATNGLKSIRVGNPAANPLTVTDPSNAAFSSAVAMMAGTAATAGRSVGINATTAGTIVLTLAGGGTLTLPIGLGWQTFPFAVTQFAFASGGAGAVYNLN